MEKTREEFIVFIHEATNDKNSPAHDELYQFLVNCFVRADTNLEGKIYLEQLDHLIEEAAALPRLYGYAPKSEDLYASAALRKSARAKLFTRLDSEKVGYVSLEQWVAYANEHILGKAAQLPKDYLGGKAGDVTKQEFVDFIKQAVNKNTQEYRQLYFFLLKCFQAGDVHGVGAVNHAAFDKMIEAAAEAPRRFGLAPKTSDLFKSDADRLAKRKEYFSKMDADHNGLISFDEWLQYAYTHIVGKANGI
jgi:hypothetical protein